MATVSKQSIIVSAAISASNSTPPGGGTVTVYTAPASSYALVNVVSGGTVLVGGQQVSTSAATGIQIVIGPSQALQVSGGTGITCYVSGVLFANS